MIAILVSGQDNASMLGLAIIFLGIFVIYAVGLWMAGWITTTYMIQSFLLVVIATLLTVLGQETGLL